MEVSIMADTLSATAQSLCFAKGLLHRSSTTASSHILCVSESSSDNASSSSSTPGSIQISSVIFPIDAVAPPPVRSRPRTATATATRTLLRKRRRTKRRSSSSSEGGEDDGFSGGSDGGDDGPFGGSGGGRGWNYDGYGGGFNWDDSSNYHCDPAFDFVFEVVCWLVFSNCLHFAFKKVIRWVGEGFPVNEREKVPMLVGN